MIAIESIIWQEEKYFVAQCLNVDVSSFGDSKEEALENLKEAVALYLEDDCNTYSPIINPELIHSAI